MNFAEIAHQTKIFLSFKGTSIPSYGLDGAHIRLFCLLTGSVSVKYASSLQMKNSLVSGGLRKKPLSKIQPLFVVMRLQLMPIEKFVRFPMQIVMQNMVDKGWWNPYCFGAVGETEPVFSNPDTMFLFVEVFGVIFSLNLAQYARWTLTILTNS